MKKLTIRQKEILQLVADGCNGREIAEKLYLSEGTVKNIMEYVYNSLGASNRAHAVAIAMRMGDIK